MPDLFYQNNIKGRGAMLCERRPEISMAMVDAFLNKMYRARADFVFTTRLATESQVSLYPWKEPKELAPLAVRHVRTFLRAHRPVAQS